MGRSSEANVERSVVRFLFSMLCCLSLIGTAPAAPPLEVYGGLPGVELLSLSPSGEKYALVAVVGETRKLVVLSYDGKVLSAASAGAAKVRGIGWAGEDHLLVVVNSTFKAPLVFRQDYELSTVINVDLVKRKATAIFDHQQSIASAVFGFYGIAQVNAHLYGYFGGISYERTGTGDYIYTHGYSDLYRVDLDTAETTREALGDETGRHWVVAPDGTVLAHSEYVEQNGKWRLFAGPSHGKALLERADPQGDVGIVGLGRSRGTVLVADDAGDRDMMEEVSAADGRTEELFGDQTVQECLYDHDSKQLIGALTQEEPRAFFFDPPLLARFKGARKAFPGLNVELVSYSRHLDRLIVKTAGGTDSGTYWLVDIASGKADPIARPYPLIKDADVGETRRIRYTASDGLPIEGILTLPPGLEAKSLPLVVMPHGGPIGEKDEIGFDWWAQAYASRGYAVLQPNFRGSSGYGRGFRQAGYGQWGRKMQTDLSDGIEALTGEGTVDPKRVCIVGASYGGYAALAGVTLQKGVYRCAVSVAGPADFPKFFGWQTERHGYKSDATRYWRAVLGADKGGDAVMASLSPALAAAQADAPILLIHGKDDTVVPIEQSDSMAAALKRAGKPYEYLIMKGEDHYLSREDTRIAMLKAAVAFVQKYNPAEKP
ncbi:MAG TPA: alpha/beta fold hydrolase [Steroidobacteraceae bacterium]|nr:alpha/beta fold hydrolase [Steroidobacteraceae bacterium]